MNHPAVANAAVFPVRTADGDEEVGACVVLREGAVLDELSLVAHCSRNMAYFMVPRYLQFLPQLPVTVNQKVEKFRLKERIEADPGSAWDRERAGVVLAR
jgi:crotonobetaine/carnitine-CoA ligase